MHTGEAFGEGPQAVGGGGVLEGVFAAAEDGFAAELERAVGDDVAASGQVGNGRCVQGGLGALRCGAEGAAQEQAHEGCVGAAALFEDRFRRAEPVVTRAVERGELPAGTDPGELLKAMVAPVYFRLVFTGEPVDGTTADRAVDIALAAAHARALSAPIESD